MGRRQFSVADQMQSIITGGTLWQDSWRNLAGMLVQTSTNPAEGIYDLRCMEGIIIKFGLVTHEIWGILDVTHHGGFFITLAIHFKEYATLTGVVCSLPSHTPYTDYCCKQFVLTQRFCCLHFRSPAVFHRKLLYSVGVANPYIQRINHRKKLVDTRN